MFSENLDYAQALLLARQLGFAESDPTLDVEGFDAANKWTFLLTHAYGIVTKTDQLVFSGIQHITSFDAAFAKEKGYGIKLVAEAKKLGDGKIAAFVLPQFVKADDPLAFVKEEYNGVVIESSFADKQFFYGKGAGSFPTASAILSDLSALGYDYKYEYKKLYHHEPGELASEFLLEVYVGFNSIRHIPTEQFAVIKQGHKRQERSYIMGVISFISLQKNNWWKDPDVSLIVMPNGIIPTFSKVYNYSELAEKMQFQD